MSQTVVSLFPTGDNADDTVRRTIDAILKGTGSSRDALAKKIDMPVSTLHRKMGGKGSTNAFKAGEAATIARALGVQITDLYDGWGGRFTPPPPDGTPAPRPSSGPGFRNKRGNALIQFPRMLAA